MVASCAPSTHWGMDVMRTGDPDNFGNGSWPGGAAPNWPWPVESPKVLLRRLEILTRRRLGPDRPAEQFELELPITYEDDSRGSNLVRTIMVPNPAVPFTTDLTSVPKLFTWLVPKSGRHLPAALIHDGLVGSGTPTYVTSDDSTIDRIDADQVFRNAMQDTGVGLIRRWLVWAAVANASLCSGARPAWAPWKKWWFRGVALLSVGLVAYLGLAATLDVVNAASLPKGLGWLLGWPLMGDLPWIDDDAAFWKATGQGLAAAIVFPLGLALPVGSLLPRGCGRRRGPGDAHPRDRRRGRRGRHLPGRRMGRAPTTGPGRRGRRGPGRGGDGVRPLLRRLTSAYPGVGSAHAG